MIANSHLLALLEQPPPGEVVVPFAYEMLLAAGFNEIEGCLLFQRFSVGMTSVIALPQFRDATGYEAWKNGHHLADYRPRELPRDQVTIAHTAVACARFLARRLRTKSSEPCRVILTVSDNDATIRFHKVRDDEPTWLSSNLEGYDEAVGYLDTTDEDIAAEP